MRPSSTSVLVRVRLIPGSEPISGTVAIADDPVVAFVGWMALAGALARAHASRG